MLTDELLVHIFDGRPHILSDVMVEWLAASRRFTAFVNTFRDKIRKKLRVTQDQESILDLRLELETAYLLLQEPRLSLEYEPPQSDKKRSPDFAVTFTTSMTFMVEVTRLRADQKSAYVDPGGETRAQTPNTMQERLADGLCSKLSQLSPQRSNILLIGVDALNLTQAEIHAMMLRLQQRVERNDAQFLQRYSFRDRAQFFNHYQRLSEVLVRSSDFDGSGATIAWINSQARYPLPGKVRTALYRTHGL